MSKNRKGRYVHDHQQTKINADGGRLSAYF